MEVKTKEAAENAVKKGAELCALLGATIANRDREVLAVQKRYGATASQYAAQIEEIKTALEAWARENRSGWDGTKSLKLPWGELQFHAGGRSVQPLKGWSWKKAAEVARRIVSWRKYIRIKFEFNKDAILEDTKGEKPKLKLDRLKKVGIYIQQAPESFSVEYVVKTKLNKNHE
jgi:phage host-nuclease inhibitor protein Gam